MSYKKLRITVDGRAYEVEVELLEERGAETPAAPAPRPAPAPRAATPPPTPAPAHAAAPAPTAAAPGTMRAPLSGVVLEVLTPVGNQVKVGDKLLSIEAMKMQSFLHAESAGRVAELFVAPGDSIAEDQPILRLE